MTPSGTTMRMRCRARWARIASPAVRDAAGAVLMAVYALLNDHFDKGHPHFSNAWAFDLALAAPLFWRRRRPFATFLAVSGVAFVQWSTGSGAPVAGDAAILVALYAVGARVQRREVIAAAAVIAQVGVVLAVVRWAPTSHRLAAAVLATGTVTAAWVIGVYTRTRRAYVASVVERAATAERERDQQALVAVAGERARISREMHDIIAHSLSVMIALSDGAAMAVRHSPGEAQQAMEQTSTLGRQALEEMHRLLGVLREPDAAPLAPAPGIAQLDELVAQVRAAGLPVDLVVKGDLADLSAGAQLAVYRLVQEGLTNVLKHARAATRAVVTLRSGPTGVDVEIDNDDRGGADGPATATSGHGLTGMRERAAVFGGAVEAGRRPDGGWHVASHLEPARQDAAT